MNGVIIFRNLLCEVGQHQACGWVGLLVDNSMQFSVVKGSQWSHCNVNLCVV